MKTVNLRSVPNQEVSFSADGTSYEIRLHYFRDVLYANITVAGSKMADGIRCVPFQWLIPDGLVKDGTGNLRFETVKDRYPDYNAFSVGTCKLVYYTAEEIADLTESSEE